MILRFPLTNVLVIILCASSCMAQKSNFDEALYTSYDSYKVEGLDIRRIKYDDIRGHISELKDDKNYTVKQVGASIGGKPINLIKFGNGDTKVLLWSQMHGDESTATRALFDIIHFFQSQGHESEKKAILDNLTIYMIPMLNPDGAENFVRQNLLGIDINRDAVRQQTPEGQTLKRVRDSLNPEFGFNLHDQSTYYNAVRTDNPASLSFLAPAYNYEKDINTVRGNAMKVIVHINQVLQNYIPGSVGRYNDDFEPRAFGDNITKWGTSTILIESGGNLNDPEKKELRKLNYVAILSALESIATKNYESLSVNDYIKIPENDRKLYDLKLIGATYNLLGNDYIVDLGINKLEVDNKEKTNYFTIGRVMEIGDLSTYYGYHTLDASGMKMVNGKVYPKIVANQAELKKLNLMELLKQGYTYVRLKQLPATNLDIDVPFNLVSESAKIPDFNLHIGTPATFLLITDEGIKYTVVNGNLIDLKNNLPKRVRGILLN